MKELIFILCAIWIEHTLLQTSVRGSECRLTHSFCSNDGTDCYFSRNDALCECVNGTLNGLTCEPINIEDECWFPCSACENGGICAWMPFGDLVISLCECPIEFTGGFCESSDSNLESDPLYCQNGGTCVEIAGDTVSCLCMDGYTGVRCQTQLSQDHTMVPGTTDNPQNFPEFTSPTGFDMETVSAPSTCDVRTDYSTEFITSETPESTFPDSESEDISMGHSLNDVSQHTFEQTELQSTHEITTTNLVFDTTESLAELSQITPSFGPVAGGTEISIYGNQLHMIDTIKMVPECGGHCSNYTTITYSSNMFQVNSSGIHINTLSSELHGFNASQPQGPRLSYRIHFKTFTNVWEDSGLLFEYRPNPSLTNITSRFTITSGGIRVTVIGENLDSVAKPLCFIYEEERIYNGDEFESNLLHIYETVITEINGYMMICKTPPIDPNNNGTEVDLQLPQRSRRSTEDIEIVLYYYLGIGFDGYRSYENYSETDPEIAQLVVFDDPSFSSRSSNDPIEFNPIKNTYLNIKGNGLTEGAKLEDYSAVIGADVCDVSEILSNRLSCRPPKREPKVRKTGNYKIGKPRLVVYCGNAVYLIGYIEYTNIKEHNLILFSLIGVGVVLIVVILIGVFLYKWKCKSRKKNVTVEQDLTNEGAIQDIDDFTNIREFPVIISEKKDGQSVNGCHQVPIHFDNTRISYLVPVTNKKDIQDKDNLTVIWELPVKILKMGDDQSVIGCHRVQNDYDNARNSYLAPISTQEIQEI